MEYRTYDKYNSSSLGVVNMMEEMQENIPILEVQKIDPPKQNEPPPIIEKIKVVEDYLKVAETIIESTETDESQAVVVKPKDIVEVREVKEYVEDIHFVLIEDVPVYSGCKGNNKELKGCFSKKVTKIFAQRFDVNLANELGFRVGKKNYLLFLLLAKPEKLSM